MKGSIRFFLGLLITVGAVGTLDVNPSADLISQIIIAMFGLCLMYWGSLAMQKQRKELQ